jgi:malic enzyme
MAIVALTALINVNKLHSEDVYALKIVVNGTGAAGILPLRVFFLHTEFMTSFS